MARPGLGARSRSPRTGRTPAPLVYMCCPWPCHQRPRRQQHGAAHRPGGPPPAPGCRPAAGWARTRYGGARTVHAERLKLAGGPGPRGAAAIARSTCFPSAPGRTAVVRALSCSHVRVPQPQLRLRQPPLPPQLLSSRCRGRGHRRRHGGGRGAPGVIFTHGPPEPARCPWPTFKNCHAGRMHMRPVNRLACTAMLSPSRGRPRAAKTSCS